MKLFDFTLRAFLLVTASILTLVLAFALYFLDAHTTLICEGEGSQNHHLFDSIFWKIEEKRENVWHILFRNVNIKYEVMMCTMNEGDTTSRFEFREIGPDYPGLQRLSGPTTMEAYLEYATSHNQDYEVREDGAHALTGSLNRNLVFVTREHNNDVVEAAMEHFNSIQRGQYHPHAHNFLNPNAHGNGVGTAGLATSANTSGTNTPGIYTPGTNTSGTNTPSSNGPNITNSISINIFTALNDLHIAQNANSAHSAQDAHNAQGVLANSTSSGSITPKKALLPGIFNPEHSAAHASNTAQTGSMPSTSSTSSTSDTTDTPGTHGTKITKNLKPYCHDSSARSSQQSNVHSQGRGINSPLDQFIIRSWLTLTIPLLGTSYFTYTNMGFYLNIVMAIIFVFAALSMNYGRSTENNWSVGQESWYTTVYNIVVNQINTIKGQSYFPFIFCVFAFILTSNLVGMVPYSFSPTSHFALTFFISFTVVVGATFIGFILHKLSFFSILVPNSCPLALLPLLVLIEFISYLARNISLGLRLGANILSGHMLLHILSEFTYGMLDTDATSFILGFIPIIFIMAFSILELGIGFIQAQVFTVLSCSYIRDSLNMH